MSILKFGNIKIRTPDIDITSAHQNIMEIDLVPAPASTAPASILVAVGRKRRQLVFDAWAPVADYEALLVDYKAKTQRTLYLPNSQTINALILDIPKAIRRREIGSAYYEYTITFVEA